jgi:protein involved in polysaccharide export with SLBB domain
LNKIRFFVFTVVLLLSVCVSFAQDKESIQQLIEMAEKGQLDKMSPQEIRQKIKDAGMTEAEAIQLAKQRNINLEKYLTPPNPQENEKKELITSPATSPTPEQPQRRDESSVPTGVYDLEYFGYKAFKDVPQAFEPSAVGPVDPGYLVGPGDILRLTVWGQAEFQYELTVDREGRVFISNIGQIFVMGTPLEKLEQKLKNQMSKYYSGLAANPPTVFMDVTIEKLRPLRIFVMGEVAHPGGYTISSYATVFNALYAVGGPIVRGTLRNVRVIRDSKVVTEVDLYDYLLKGKNTSDVRLQNNDVVFVPLRGKTVSIRGNVRRQAIYELKGGENFSTLLEFCGGLLPSAYTLNAQVERIKSFDQRSTIDDRIVLDIPLNDILTKKAEDFTLLDSDDIEVFPILDVMKNFVTIRGPVYRPGRYELGKVKTVRELITAAEGVLPLIYSPKAYISRLSRDELNREIIPFDLQKVMDKSQNEDIPLKSKDDVILLSIEVAEVKNQFVNITGQVKKPGQYPLQTNMTLEDLILLAGGFEEDVDLTDAEVARLRPGGYEGDSLVVLLWPKISDKFSYAEKNVEKLSPNSEDARTFLLQHRDIIRIRSNPKYNKHRNVILTGDIAYPGAYSLAKKGETLSEILTRSGGTTPTSYLGGSEFWRNGKRLLVDFEKAFVQRDFLHDVIMLSGDSIFVPSRPYTVSVYGEVNNPGLLSYIRGDDVSDYVKRAGGLTDSASYAILIQPTGESQEINFGWLSSDPDVPEGSTIRVLKIQPPNPAEKVDVTSLVKDTFAILTSAATLAFIVYQVTK